MRNMASFWGDYDGMVVVCAVHTRAEPSFVEWRAYLRNVGEALAERPGFVGAVGLAVTDGGAPTIHQRAALVHVTGSIRPKAAVVSNSRLVRVAVTALQMFRYDLRVFRPEDYPAACDFLAIPPTARARLAADIRRAAATLDRCATAAALG